MRTLFTKTAQHFLPAALLCCLAFSKIVAQTTYVGPANGDWFAAANWSNGLPAAGNNALVPGGASVNINAALTVNFDIEIFGSITVRALVTNASGTIANSGTMTFNGVPGAQGSLTNQGTFNNFGTATFGTPAAFFTNETNATWSNSGNFNLQTPALSRGNVVNNGTVSGPGEIDFAGGTFDNRQKIDLRGLKIGAGLTFTNNFGSTLRVGNGPGNGLDVLGLLNNFGLIELLGGGGGHKVTGELANQVNLKIVSPIDLTINAGGKLTNGGTFAVESGNVVNNGTVANSGTIANSGAFNNNGVFDNNNRLENLALGTFTHNGGGSGVLNSGFGSLILNGGAFTATKPINSAGTLTNNGNFTNQSTISMASGSVFDNNSVFVNDNAGVLSTSNTATNDGTFTNRGTLNVLSGSIFTNNAALTNATSGKINNGFEIRNSAAPATLTNNGALTNNVRMFLSGNSENNGYWLNAGDLTVNAASTLTNRAILEQSGGNISNLGTLANPGFLFNEDCSSLANRAGATLSNTGTLENRGIVFQRGTATGNAFADAGGYVHTAANSNAPTICSNQSFGADVNGVVKVDAPELVAFANFDSCQNIIYRANGIARPLFGCADAGTTKAIAFSLRTRLNDSLTCTTATPITDPLAPIFANCPADQVVFTAGDNAAATWTAPTATDNCTTTTLATSHAPGANFPVGITGVTYTATDTRGNSQRCQFRISVVKRPAPPANACTGDVTGPALTCPANVSVSSDFPTARATWTEPSPADNCLPMTLNGTRRPGEEFPLGSTTVTYTARDGNGNSRTCTFSIVVSQNNACATDLQRPVFQNCPGNIFAAANAVIGGNFVRWTPPGVSDNCTPPTLTASHQPNSFFASGSTTVTYTATDAAANSATCAFTVVVGADPCPGDASGPTVAGCPTNQTRTTSTSSATATWAAPTFTDACTPVTVFASHQPGATFPLGATTVTYQASDRKGNRSTCSFVITVSNPCVGDATPPVIANCPVNQTLAATSAAGATATWTAPTASDACGSVSLTASFAPGSLFPVGQTDVAYLATDAAGNSANCVFRITVQSAPNTCTTNAAPINNSTGINPASVALSWNSLAGATAYDVFLGTANPPTTVLASNVAGTSTTATNLAPGTTYFWYVVPKNAAGPATGCQTTATQFQTATGPSCADITYAGGSNSISIGGLTAPRVAVQVFNSNWISVFNCFDANCSKPTLTIPNLTNGTYIVKVDFYNTNYSVICSDQRNVTVGGTATTLNINCPANITVTATTGATSATANYAAPTATSNCTTGTVTVARTGGLASGSAFPLGLSSVTYQASDGCGNVRSCSFTVTVNAPAAPILTLNCPADVIVTAAPGAASAIANYAAPLGTSTCTSGTVTTNRIGGPASGAAFPLGSTLITYQASDGCGNVRSCSFNVVVNADTGQPSCANLTYTGSANSIAVGGLTAPHVSVQVFTSAWLPVFSCFDGNCAKPTTTITNLATGTYIVKVDLYNSAWGLICQDQKNVTVGGTAINLNLNCPTNVSVTAAAGAATATVNYAAPTATSNCTTGTVTVARTAGLASGSAFPLGVSQVSYQATDGCGNVRSCSFLVTVNSPNPAVLTLNCPANITVTAAAGATTATANYTAPVGTSTCPTGTVTTSRTVGLASGSAFPLGTNTVTFQASDGCANVRSCSFTVTVNQTGGTPSCATVTYTGGAGSLMLGNLTAPNIAVQVFTSAWVPVFSCFGNTCSKPNLTVPSLAAGTYIVKLDYYNANFGLICSDQRNVVVNAPRTLQASDLTLSAFKKGQSAELKWLSTTGERNDYFVLERRAEGSSFQPISMLEGTGEAGEVLYFSTLDENPLPGENQYRLRLVFRDGSETVSPLVALVFPRTESVGLFPNPARERATVSLGENPGKNTRILITDQLGQLLREAAVPDFEKLAELDLSGLESGFYLLRVVRAGERDVVLKLVVERG